jgi:hypothetical protein
LVSDKLNFGKLNNHVSHSFTDLAFGISDQAFETTFVNGTLITEPARKPIPGFDCKIGLKIHVQCVKGQILETWIVEQVIGSANGKPRRIFVNYMYCCTDGSEMPTDYMLTEEPPREIPSSAGPKKRKVCKKILRN